MNLEELAHRGLSASRGVLLYNAPPGECGVPRAILALPTAAEIMKQVLEFIPIVLFFVVYQLDGEVLSVGTLSYTFDGIFSATAVLIAATAVQVIVARLMAGYWDKRNLWTFVAVAIFGGATLALRDQTFIQWKPTIFNWGLALIFVAFQLFSERSLLERALGAQLTLPRSVWTRLNLVWTANFVIVGALNLYVAYRFSEAFWVSYKLYSAIGFTLLLTVLTAVLVSPHLQAQDAVGSGNSD
jgi:intracellular septation protein